MQQDEQNERLEQSLEQVEARKTSFSELPPYQKPKLMQRIGKKRTYWYVQPFGEAQNAYNAAAAEALSALTKQVQRLQAELNALTEQSGQELAALRQEQRQAIARTQNEQSETVRQLAAALDGSLAAAAPECRTAAGRAPLTALTPIGTEALFREYHAVQQAEGQAQTDAALHALEERYAQQLHDQLEKTRTAAENRRIAVICRENGAAESVREAEALFALMQRAGRYPVCLLYVLPAGSPAAQKGNVYRVPENRLSDWVSVTEPALLIICEAAPELLTAGNQCLLLRNALVCLSGQNPVQGLGGSKMQELLHLNDCGLHRYCTASAYAADVLEAYGFRRPGVLYPVPDSADSALTRRPRAFDPERFTVGFACAPEAPQQSDARGIPVLCDTVRENPDIRFLILWDSSVPVPEALKSAHNTDIRTGNCDRAAFFSDIDCILVPFAEQDGNPACPRIAFEAMLLGIPAAVTPVSGIAGAVAESGMGIVTDGTDAAAIGRALLQISEQYPAFSELRRQEKLRSLSGANGFVRDAEAQLAGSMPQPVHTMFEWDRQLKLKSQHLLKGQAALKAYFQRRTADTAVYPQNCFDEMERISVRSLLRHLCGTQNELRLLDLMSGEGRLLRELLPFGSCTAYEPSSAMMNRLRAQFPSGVTLHEADPLSGGISGQYDVITVFRLIRHYEYGTRKKLWALLRGALAENGLLLFDVPNRRFQLPYRAKNGWDQCPVYDIFWTKESVAEELAANGLKLTALVPVGQGLYPLPAEYRGEPVTWTACAVRA
ncbi:MAG: methyltransferase domain-containing protein [Oscillospiraceae bacterium]|nr:methyltransferase domain-containing protein [Oscillospiraceae bacterium]